MSLSERERQNEMIRKRKEVRYLLRRLRTEADGGEKAPSLPKGFKKSFETQDKFRGWKQFQVTWDVYPEDPYNIRLLDQSAEEEWNKLLQDKVPELPRG